MVSMNFFPQSRVMEPALIFYGNVRETIGETPGEETAPLVAHHIPVFLVDLDGPQSAGGTLGLENEGHQIVFSQPYQAAFHPLLHPGGVIDLRLARHQPGGLHRSDQPHGFPGSRETALHLRADRHEIAILTQGIRDEAVSFVTAVETDLVPQQTAADAATYFIHVSRLRCGRVIRQAGPAGKSRPYQ